MTSSNTSSLGDIIQVQLPEHDDIKCFGKSLMSGGIRPCKRRLGEDRQRNARNLLRREVTYQELSGGLVKGLIKDLAQLLVSHRHSLDARGDLERQWLALLEQHREAQEAAQGPEQLHEVESSQPLPTLPEHADFSASTVQAPNPESSPVAPTLPEVPLLPESRRSMTPRIQVARQETLPQSQVRLRVQSRSVEPNQPVYHPTPFARRIPTYSDDYSVSLSPNWILSYVMSLVMQAGQNVLAMLHVQFGTVSTRDAAGQITKEPVTHLRFLLGVNFSIGRSHLVSGVYVLLFVALARLVVSVFWPLSGYLAGIYVILLASGVCNRRMAIEE
ncbi:uncharacterized protein N7498_004714 [Penicillium cinerascens]|uniref:Uncharacterized protein n=1 Tax=Penicillium cinerascens TaxID=70096 RepID=A0A9W9MM16_9EURO|nr:uncharacterized protein N7498_004714 [Penicillium cinerascens]KAJ5203835.1 hypothetical protein N7498_004714 [Penicillium cinerascens]